MNLNQNLRSDMNNKKRQSTVVVIGSGISGLYCAHSLKKMGVDVMVLEAADYIGGRMKQLKGWIDWKTVDLGAEFIHGRDSILNSLINENGWPSRLLFTWAQGDGEHPEELFGKEYSMYYLGKEKQLLPYDTKDEEITKLNELLFSLSDLEVNPNDKRTLEQYLRQNGISDKGIAIADAGYSNSLCAVSRKMSLYETVQINREWDRFGAGDFRLDNSTGELINFLSKDLDVRTGFVVKEIDYQNPIVVITNKDGDKIYCQHVVVTVPLMILKEKSIQFIPNLPKFKIDAINALEVDNAIKVVLTFSHRFWPSRLNGVICSDTLIPEMWFEHEDRVGELTPYSKNVEKKIKSKKQTFVVSAFACSEFADKISKIPEKELVKRILSQLDDMFGMNRGFTLYNQNEADPQTNIPNPATTFFIDYRMQDWSKEPFIKGGYSHPAFTANQKVREDLAAPLLNRVFWAGEATHPKAYMTMHGAIETGDYATKNIIKVLESKSSNNFTAQIQSKL